MSALTSGYTKRPNAPHRFPEEKAKVERPYGKPRSLITLTWGGSAPVRRGWGYRTTNSTEHGNISETKMVKKIDSSRTPFVDERKKLKIYTKLQHVDVPTPNSAHPGYSS